MSKTNFGFIYGSILLTLPSMSFAIDAIPTKDGFSGYLAMGAATIGLKPRKPQNVTLIL